MESVRKKDEKEYYKKKKDEKGKKPTVGAKTLLDSIRIYAFYKKKQPRLRSIYNQIFCMGINLSI